MKFKLSFLVLILLLASIVSAPRHTSRRTCCPNCADFIEQRYGPDAMDQEHKDYCNNICDSFVQIGVDYPLWVDDDPEYKILPCSGQKEFYPKCYLEGLLTEPCERTCCSKRITTDYGNGNFHTTKGEWCYKPTKEDNSQTDPEGVRGVCLPIHDCEDIFQSVNGEMVGQPLTTTVIIASGTGQGMEALKENMAEVLKHVLPNNCQLTAQLTNPGERA